MFYGGVLVLLTGIAATIRPMKLLRLPTRMRGVSAAAAGGVLVFLACVLVPDVSLADPAVTGIDEFAPRFHFREHHETMVEAAPDHVFEAIKSVSADEIALFQLFTWMRRFGRSGPESILNAPGRRPILEVATQTGFLLLADRAPSEVVVGTVVVAPAGFRRADAATAEAYRHLAQAGFAKATMNFKVEARGPSASRVTTETRVFATSGDALARFTPYWRAIYPGSAILRVTWLRAIKERAERVAR